jgi:hypothetical protein
MIQLRYRNDGQIIAVGGVHPSVRVYTVSTREILREFKGHKGYVYLFPITIVYLLQGGTGS